MSSYAVAEAFGVRDQVVIITGAAGKVGQGIAEAFAVNEARCVFSDRAGEGLTRLTEKLVAKVGGSARDRLFACPADLTREEDLRALVDFAVRKFGRLDGLINCGAIPNSGPLWAETAASFDRIYHTNVRSLWLLSKFAAEAMSPAPAPDAMGNPKGGSIVNISSINGHRAMFFCSLYAGSKAAVMATTREMATELAARLIRVNSISPGAIQDPATHWQRVLSRLHEPYRSEIDKEFHYLGEPEAQSTIQPLPRHGTPFDIAMGCIYLCSPAARFITGADLVIDGGRLVEIPEMEPRTHQRGRFAWGPLRERLRNLPDAAWIDKPNWLRAEQASPKDAVASAK